LRAIAVFEWRSRVFGDFTFPAHSAESRKRFLENFFLEAYLLVCIDMLILAPATDLEMRATRTDSRFRRLHDFRRDLPMQVSSFAISAIPELLHRKNKRHKNSSLAFMRQTVTAVHKFLN